MTRPLAAVALVAIAVLLGAQAPAPPQSPAQSPPAAPPASPSVERPVAPAGAGAAKLPGAIDSAYVHLKPGAARRKTCSVQYKANKADGGNAGLKWPAFYKACNTKLKGLH